MPSYMIHLAEAELIYRELIARNVLKSNPLQPEDVSWKIRFMYGCLLLDLAEETRKAFSHFWTWDSREDLIRTPNLEAFLSNYDAEIFDPVLYGYYAHLYLDKYFLEDYIWECIYSPVGIHPKRSDIRTGLILPKSGKRIIFSDLFSQKYIYDDYTKLNAWLIRKYQLYQLKLPEQAWAFPDPVREGGIKKPQRCRNRS